MEAQAQQHRYMAEVVQGMQTGDITKVANALSTAVKAHVSLPDDFLGTVKQWMDSRSKSAQAAGQVRDMVRPPSMSPMIPGRPSAPGPSVVPGIRGAAFGRQGFYRLEHQLEDAIRRGDVQAQWAVLQHAAQLAAAGGGSPSPGALTPSGFTPFAPGGVTPTPWQQAQMQQASMFANPGGMTPMPGQPHPAMMTPPLPGRQGAVTPKAYQQGAPTPMVMQPPMGGAATPMLGAATPLTTQTMGSATPTIIPPPPPPPPQQQPGQHTRHAPKPPKKAQPRSPALSPTVEHSDDEGRAKVKPKAPGKDGKKRKKRVRRVSQGEGGTAGAGASAKPGEAEDVVDVEHQADHAPVSPLIAPGHDSPELLDAADSFGDVGAPEFFEPRPVTEAELINFLRDQDADTATYKSLGLHFKNSEAVRAVIESAPGTFVVHGDQVSLKDQGRKEALDGLAKELNKKVFRMRRINPDEALEPVLKAAACALDAYPADVCQLLRELARNILRKPGVVGKTKYSASMPLVLACLVDRIVLLERRRGGSAKFENALSQYIHRVIFKRWVMGVVPGSQFLANLLITWERLGYFKVKHLQDSMKTMWLLIAYARAEGVPDGATKEQGLGWYAIVRRDTSELEGCQAICPKRVRGEQEVGMASKSELADTPDKRDRTLKAAAQMGLGPGVEEPAAKRIRADEK